MKYTVYVLLLLATLGGCQSDPDGTYLIYQTEIKPDYGLGKPGHNYEASTRLSQMFKGKKLKLQFTPKYAIIQEIHSDEDLILNNVESSDPLVLRYDLVYTKGQEKVSLTLSKYVTKDKETVVNLAVTISKLDRDVRGVLKEGQYGDTFCTLEKQKTASTDLFSFKSLNALFSPTESPRDQKDSVILPPKVTEQFEPIYSDLDSTVLDTTVSNY